MKSKLDERFIDKWIYQVLLFAQCSNLNLIITTRISKIVLPLSLPSSLLSLSLFFLYPFSLLLPPSPFPLFLPFSPLLPLSLSSFVFPPFPPSPPYLPSLPLTPLSPSPTPLTPLSSLFPHLLPSHPLTPYFLFHLLPILFPFSPLPTPFHLPLTPPFFPLPLSPLPFSSSPFFSPSLPLSRPSSLPLSLRATFTNNILDTLLPY